MGAPELDRYDGWLTWLRETAAADDDVRAVRVGGSAATGGFDQWSDLDVDVLCAPGTSAAVAERWLACMRADHEVASVWHLPDSTWPDGRQFFLAQQAAPGDLVEPVRVLDVHVSDLSDTHRRLDPRRHGVPLVLHDPDGVLESALEDGHALATAACDALEQVRQRRAVGDWLVARAARRGDLPEAVDLYQRFVLAPLVRTLRTRWSPWRHDYGVRYLRADLPEDVARRVALLLPQGDLEDQVREAGSWLDALLAEPVFPCWAEDDRVWLCVDTGTDAATLWAHLTGAEGLDAWLAALDGEPGPGATYGLWHDDLTRSEHTVLDWEPERRLRLTWDFPDEEPSEVSFLVDGGRLWIEHRGLTSPASYAAGWRQHARYLVQHLAGHPLAPDAFWDEWDERVAQEQSAWDAQRDAGAW